MVNLIGSILVLEHLSFSVAPELIFEDSGFEEITFAAHFDLFSEFEFDDFHVRPMVGYSNSKGNTILMPEFIWDMFFNTGLY